MVFAINPIMLGWKTHKYDMKPSNFATQGQPKPRKNRYKRPKTNHQGTCNRFLNNFRGSGCGLGVVMAFVGFRIIFLDYVVQPTPTQQNLVNLQKHHVVQKKQWDTLIDVGYFLGCNG